MSTYAIYSENGQELSQFAAPTRTQARKIAQRSADEMGETVYLDTVPSSTDPDDDEDTGEAIEPSAVKVMGVSPVSGEWLPLTIAEKRVVLSALDPRQDVPTGRVYVIDGFRVPEVQ